MMKKYKTGGSTAPKPKPKPPLKEAPGNRDPYEPMPPRWKPEPRKPLGPSGQKGYAKGGNVMKKSDKAGRALVKKSADTMGRAMMKKACGGKAYAKGGSVSARADGIAKKGKTKGKVL